MGAQRFQSALHRLGGQVPVRGNLSSQFREVPLPQSCQQFRRQLSLQQSAVQGVLGLGSRKTDIHIQHALTPVPDGHIDRTGAVAVGQFLPPVIFYQIKRAKSPMLQGFSHALVRFGGKQKAPERSPRCPHLHLVHFAPLISGPPAYEFCVFSHERGHRSSVDFTTEK